MKLRARSLLRCALLGAGASLVLYAGSCGSHEPTGTGGAGGGGELADVIYEGGANEAALEALAAIDPVVDPPRYAWFDAPTEGAMLPASPAPTFSWHIEILGKDGGARAPGPRSRSRWALVDLLDGWRAPRARAALGPLLDLIGPERTAAAGPGAPLDGTAYFLVIQTPSDSKLLRVFTTSTTYTPDAAAWAKVKAAEGPINAWLLMGTFENGALAGDGGPFRGPWVSFSVAP